VRPKSEGFVRKKASEDQAARVKKAVTQIAESVKAVAKATAPATQAASSAPRTAKANYASYTPAQRKQIRESKGVLSPKARKQIDDIHAKRVRAYEAMHAAAVYANLHMHERSPTKLEGKGLVLAHERAQRHGQSMDEVLAPFREIAASEHAFAHGATGSGKVNGDALDDIAHGLGKAGSWTKQALLDLGTMTGTSQERDIARVQGGVDRTADVDRELSGRGQIMKALSDLGDELGRKGLAKSMPGGENRATAGINEESAANIMKDFVTLPATAVTSAYVPATQAAHGHIAQAAGTVLGGYKELAEHPLKTFAEHPLGTALMLYGVKGAVGRGVGGTMRSGVLGKGAKDAASLERAPKVVPDTHLATPRRHSRDAFDRAVEVVRDRRADHRVQRRTEEAEQATTPAEARELREQAAKADRRRMSDSEIEHIVDRVVGARGEIKRRNQAKVRHAVRKTGVDDAAGIIAQNIARPHLEDLRAYRDELIEARTDLDSPAKVKANERLVDALDRAIKGFHPGRVEVAARRYAEIVRPLQEAAVELGLLDPRQADTAAWIPYARRNMGARFEQSEETRTRITHLERLHKRAAEAAEKDPTDTHMGLERFRAAELAAARAEPARLVDEHRRPLELERIKQHAHSYGIDNPPAWISQAPAHLGRDRRRTLAEPSVSSRQRTGAATVEGTMDTSRRALEESAVRQQELVDEARAYRAHIETLGLRDEGGKLRTFQSRDAAVQAVADHNAQPGATPMRAVRLTALGARRAQVRAALEHADEHAATQLVVESVRDALEGRETPSGGSWAAIPDVAARRLLEHLDSRSQHAAGKVGNVVTSMFRRTVLPLSPKWAAGNVIEGALRSVIAGAGPTSWVAGRRTLRALEELDPDAGAQARAMLAPGGMYALGLRGEIRRGLEDWQGDGKLDNLARRLIELRESPGPRQVAGAYRAYTDAVFGVMGWMESHFQTAMLGRALKQLGLREGHLHFDAAIADAAAGLRGTSNQVALARRVSDMYGQYSGFSPAARKAITTYTPFAPWWISALKFCLIVIPRDHPIMAGLLASNAEATEEWRRQLGLNPLEKNSVPGWLQGSIPSGHGGLLPLSRYTMFGAFTDPAGTAADEVLPQISGALAALRGEDWKGRKLKGADGGPASDLDKARYAALSMIEGTIPGIQLGESIHKNGVATALNPFRTYSQTAPSTPLDDFADRLNRQGGDSRESDAALERFTNRVNEQGGGSSESASALAKFAKAFNAQGGR